MAIHISISRRCLALPWLLVALVGCGPTGDGAAPAAGMTARGVATPLPTTSVDPRGWTVTTAVTTGSIPTMTVTLEARGPVTVTNGCGVRYGIDAWLVDTNGQRVTPQRVQNYMCAIPPGGVYQPTVVAPGATQQFITGITLETSGYPSRPLPPGIYTVHGMLSVDPAKGVSGDLPVVTVALS